MPQQYSPTYKQSTLVLQLTPKRKFSFSKSTSHPSFKYRDQATMKRHLLDLPIEILYLITSHLDREADINSLARTTNHLYNTANTYLYRFNAIHKDASALLWAARHESLHTFQHSLSSGTRAPADTLHEALSIAIKTNNTEMAEALLSQEEEVDLNILYQGGRDASPATFLGRAAQMGHVEMVKLLLSKNAIDPNLGKIGPPLAIAAYNSHHAVVDLLLNAPGVDLNLRDSGGCTPLFSAVFSGSEAVLAQFIVHPGVDINAGLSSVQYVTNMTGWTPLMFAVSRGHKRMVARLLELPTVDAGHRSIIGETALHIAAARGLENIVQLILAKTADPDPKDFRGQSPLFRAAGGGHLSIVKLLYEFGADPKSSDIIGITPIVMADKNEHPDVVQFLKESKDN